jgi:hypothetical protein
MRTGSVILINWSVAEVSTKRDDRDLYSTEATLKAPASQHLGSSPWEETQKYGVDIIGDLNQHTMGWIEWNVLLDFTGSAACIGPSGSWAVFDRCDSTWETLDLSECGVEGPAASSLRTAAMEGRISSMIRHNTS